MLVTPNIFNTNKMYVFVLSMNLLLICYMLGSNVGNDEYSG